MTASVGLLATLTSPAPARAECIPARTSPTQATLPEAWQAAVLALVRSTAEVGHPWSCAGGAVELRLDATGAVLRVARPGEAPISRQVASPEEVLPLGQALLAMPLAPPVEAAPPGAGGQNVDAAAAADELPPHPRAVSLVEAAPAAPGRAARAEPSQPSRRLLLGGGVDARAVGGSGVGWVGPTVSAGLVMGRWLPAISLRQQSDVSLHGPGINEVSVAIAVQSRFEISRFELRTGLVFRGAAVLRDLPRPLGEQSRLEGRIGVVTSFVMPVFRWGSVVLTADGDVVGLSRESTEPTTSTADHSPTSFPTYTIGGSACLELPL